MNMHFLYNRNLFKKISVTFIIRHGYYLKLMKALGLRFSFSSCLCVFRDLESHIILEFEKDHLAQPPASSVNSL